MSEFLGVEAVPAKYPRISEIALNTMRSTTVNNFDFKRDIKVIVNPETLVQKDRKRDETPDDDLSDMYSVDELLVSAEETEMDLETAYEVLNDPEADPELKMRANELLGESDHTGLDSELRESSIIRGNGNYSRDAA